MLLEESNRIDASDITMGPRVLAFVSARKKMEPSTDESSLN